MRPLYTGLLFASAPVGAGFHTSAAVPVGYRWVVRDINVLSGFGGAHGLGGCLFTDDGGAPLFQVNPAEATGARLYRWAGRQELAAADHITMLSFDDDWSWRITGYVLKE